MGKKKSSAHAVAKLAELEKGTRLQVCHDLMRLYLPDIPLPTSRRKCRAALQSVHVNIWDHIEGNGKPMPLDKLRKIKRKRPFPLDQAKQSETLRCLLR